MLFNDGSDISFGHLAIHDAFRVNQYTGSIAAGTQATGIGDGDFVEKIASLDFAKESVHHIVAAMLGTRTTGMTLGTALDADEDMF
jgi:hypothetical protein